MRENIGLFKAKDIVTNEWREGHLLKAGNIFYIAVERYNENIIFNQKNCDNTFIFYRIDPETICECTGLKDKNGNKIFENDEIYFLDGMSTENGFDDFNNTGFVKWSEEEARFYVTDRESVSSEDALNYCTIIGNKFDNKLGE